MQNPVYPNQNPQTQVGPYVSQMNTSVWNGLMMGPGDGPVDPANALQVRTSAGNGAPMTIPQAMKLVEACQVVQRCTGISLSTALTNMPEWFLRQIPEVAVGDPPKVVKFKKMMRYLPYEIIQLVMNQTIVPIEYELYSIVPIGGQSSARLFNTNGTIVPGIGNVLNGMLQSEYFLVTGIRFMYGVAATPGNPLTANFGLLANAAPGTPTGLNFANEVLNGTHNLKIAGREYYRYKPMQVYNTSANSCDENGFKTLDIPFWIPKQVQIEVNVDWNTATPVPAPANSYLYCGFDGLFLPMGM